MNIFSKIKHLHIGAKAKSLFQTGRTKLNNLSTKNKRLVATGLSVITIGSAAVATSSVVNHTKMERNKSDNSIVMENENPTDTDDAIYGPQLNGEIPTNANTDKKEEKNDEFLSDKLNEVEIKDEEDKKNEDVKQEINGNTDSITVDGKEAEGYVAIPNGEEIVEKVEYTGDGFVVNGVAYETLEDANRNNVGTIDFVDNTQYYPGANGEYYLTQEDADNSYKVEYYENDTYVPVETEDPNTYVISDDEINTSDNFYWDEENGIRWASYDDYLLVTNPVYTVESDYTEEVVDNTNTNETDLDNIDITDEYEEIVYGPDGEVYPSLEAYNEAMAKKVQEAASEDVFEETKEEEKSEVVEQPGEDVFEETKEETKPDVVEDTKEETKTEVKEETKEETKPDVVEETKEETKPEVKEETKEETKTDVVEETKEETKTEEKEESFDDLDELLSNEGWPAPDGTWWASEEDYLLVNGLTQESASKTR